MNTPEENAGQVDYNTTHDHGPAQSVGLASGTAQQQATESDKHDKQNDQHTTSVDSSPINLLKVKTIKDQ